MASERRTQEQMEAAIFDAWPESALRPAPMENWHGQEGCPYHTPSGICTRDRQNQYCLCRPAPSQSEEAAAVEKLVNLPHELERSGYNREFFDKRMRAALLAFAAAVRAEATLAGAAAEREAIEGLTATLEDEQAAHQDTLRLLAAKDREIAALRGALRWYNENCPSPFNKRAWDALADSPAPDPAEAMRAKCEAVAREEEVANHSVNGTRSAHQIRMRIAALKGNGEGL